MSKERGNCGRVGGGRRTKLDGGGIGRARRRIRGKGELRGEDWGAK